jgi:hypothetical protein
LLVIRAASTVRTARACASRFVQSDRFVPYQVFFTFLHRIVRTGCTYLDAVGLSVINSTLIVSYDRDLALDIVAGKRAIFFFIRRDN